MAPDSQQKEDDINTTPDDNQPDHEQTPDAVRGCRKSEEDSSINNSGSESNDEEVPQQHSKYNLCQWTVHPQ